MALLPTEATKPIDKGAKLVHSRLGVLLSQANGANIALSDAFSVFLRQCGYK